MDLTGILARGRADCVRFCPASLDAAPFLLVDMRGSLGPYLNVFLYHDPVILLVAIERSSPYVPVLQVAATLLIAFSRDRAV